MWNLEYFLVEVSSQSTGHWEGQFGEVEVASVNSFDGTMLLKRLRMALHNNLLV